ncbi:MAG TPA: histidine phosphatase family protein [Candidatus Paceibacterota bacterium]
MEIFLVRHGQTEGNVAKRHQSDATPLTDLGKKQIAEAAAFLKTKEPTHLLSSSVLRAVESAQMIGIALEMVPETNPVFAELERPQFLQGNFLKSVGSLWFYARWYFGFTRAKEGGESYRAIRDRIIKAQEYLAQYPADSRIVVVSHSVFINFFVAHMCQKGPMNPFQAAHRFLKVLTIKNGSVTRVVYDPAPAKQTCHWRLEG